MVGVKPVQQIIKKLVGKIIPTAESTGAIEEFVSIVGILLLCLTFGMLKSHKCCDNCGARDKHIL